MQVAVVLPPSVRFTAGSAAQAVAATIAPTEKRVRWMVWLEARAPL